MSALASPARADPLGGAHPLEPAPEAGLQDIDRDQHRDRETRRRPGHRLDRMTRTRITVETVTAPSITPGVSVTWTGSATASIRLTMVQRDTILRPAATRVPARRPGTTWRLCNETYTGALKPPTTPRPRLGPLSVPIIRGLGGGVGW